MSLNKISSKDLKDKCKLLKLKDYGKKEDMIARIEKHYIDYGLGIFILEDFIDEINFAKLPSNSSPHSSPQLKSESSTSNTKSNTVSNVEILVEEEEEEEEEEEQEEPRPKKRKVLVKPVYIVQQICENETQALRTIRDSGCWKSFCKTTQTKSGIRSYYACKYKSCSKKIGLWYDPTKETVRIVKSANIEHFDEEEEESHYGIDDNTKKAIEQIFLMGTKTAQGILYALRDSSILNSLPTTIDKEKIGEFTQKQIENYIFQTLKPKFSVKNYSSGK